MFTTLTKTKASVGRPVMAAVAGMTAAGLMLAAPAAPANAAAGPVSGGKAAAAKAGLGEVAPAPVKVRRAAVPIASAVLYVNRMPSIRPEAPRRNVLRVTTDAGCWRGKAVVQTETVNATTLKVTVKVASRPKCAKETSRVRTVSIPAQFATFIDGATGEVFVPEEVATY